MVVNVSHVFVGPHFFRWSCRSSGCRSCGVRAASGCRVDLNGRRLCRSVPRRGRLVGRTALRTRQTRHKNSRCKRQGRDKQQRSPIHDASSSYRKRPASSEQRNPRTPNINWTEACRAALELLWAHCYQVEPGMHRRVTGRRTALCRWPVRSAPSPGPVSAARCGDTGALQRTGAVRT
jgi:hypothetical protein